MSGSPDPSQKLRTIGIAIETDGYCHHASIFHCRKASIVDRAIHSINRSIVLYALPGARLSWPMPQVFTADMSTHFRVGSWWHVMQYFLVYRFFHLFLISLFIFSYGLLVLLLVSD